MRIGIFGGTFDPVHKGHLKAMENYKELGKLDKLIVMPTGTPPHKAFSRTVSDKDRLNMLRIAVSHMGEVSDYEMRQEGKSYTVLTLEHFKDEYPDDELLLYMGSDMFLAFETVWHRFKDIMKMCTLFVLSRNGSDRSELLSYGEHLESVYNAKVEIYDAAPFEVSSSEIREKLNKGEDVKDLLPDGVYEYIKENELYGGRENV